MRQLLFILLLIATAPFSSAKEVEFTYYLTKEPSSLSPSKLRGSGTSYLFFNLFRGLYVYDSKLGLLPEGAKSCVWKKNYLKLTCQLNKKMKWSDGQTIEAGDYVRAFRHFIDPKSKSIRAELLFRLRNARNIFAGKVKTEELGVEAKSKSELVFHFSSPDPEFKYNLSNPLLVPLRETVFGPITNAPNLITNGPYKVSKWVKGRRIHLSSNQYFYRGSSERPNVKILFIAEDSTALNLYESGKINFLWRLPTKLISAYQKRSDFVQFPLIRFDYLGFGKNMNHPKLRKALSLSIDYKKLQTLYKWEGRPGCPSLPSSFMDKEVCLSFEPQKAKKLFDSLPERIKKKRYQLVLSHFGGDGNRTTAQGFQAEWKTNLGIEVDILQVDQKYFLKKIKKEAPDIFRKGVGLLKPTCTSALRTFHSSGDENYIRWKNPLYDQIIRQMSFLKPSLRKRKACRKGIELLLKENSIIPLGEMHFSFLVDPQFKGWKVNSLNQLDLAGLHIQKK